MNRKGEMSVGEIVLLAIGIMLGAIFFVVIADTTTILTDAQDVTDESFDLGDCYAVSVTKTHINESSSLCNQTLVNIPSSWQVNDSAYNVFGVTVTNSTGGLELVDASDYNLYGGIGVIQYLNTSNTEALAANNTLTDYSFYDSGYNKDSGSRSMARIILIFFALIVLAFSVKGIREWIN